MIAAMERLIDLDLLQVRSVLPILLQDRTTDQNIIWATDTYEAYGEGYSAKESITSALVTGENSSIIQPRIAKTVSDQADRTKKHAEVFTPAWICNMMVNHCDELWFGRKDVFNTSEEKNWTPSEAPIEFPKRKRWQRYVDSRRLEITCGEAPYLVSRYDACTGELIPFNHRIGMLDRKLRVVNENAVDEAEWLKFTFRALESVYGFEYQGDNLLIARVNVLMTFMDAVQERWQREATAPELKRAAEIISWNIWQMDGLKGTVPFGSLQEAHTQLSIWDLLGEMNPAPEENKRPECQIYDWRGQGKLKYNDRKTRKGSEMKFDFVIGNPPYQEEQKGDSNTATPVYHKFMDAAYKVSDKVLLITPARFLFNTGYTPKPWNQERLNDTHFKIVKYYTDAAEAFSGVEIKGGVAISYRDIEKEFGPIEVFTTFPMLNKIFHKVIERDDFKSLCDVIITSFAYHFTQTLYDENPHLRGRTSKGHDFDLQSNVFDTFPEVFFDEKPTDGDYIRILGRAQNQRCWKYIKRAYVNHVDNLDTHKLFFSKATGTGQFGETLPDGVPGYPGDGATITFLSIGFFSSRYEIDMCQKYLKTKFARALLGVLKATQNGSKPVFKMIPIQDFSSASDLDWSASVAEIDRQLYKKYSLSEEEIAFIETNVKEMA